MSFGTIGFQNLAIAQNQLLFAANQPNKHAFSNKTTLIAAENDSTGLAHSKSTPSSVSYPPKVVKSAPVVPLTNANLDKSPISNIKIDKKTSAPNGNVVKTTPVATPNVVKTTANGVKTAPIATPNGVKTAPIATPNVVKTTVNVVKIAPTTTVNVVKIAPTTTANGVKTAPTTTANGVKTAPTTTANGVKPKSATNQNIAKTNLSNTNVAKSAPVANPSVIRPTASVKTASVQPVKTIRVTPVLNNVMIHNASILNGENDDFSPTLCENGLLFCTNSIVRAKNGQLKKSAAPSVNDPKPKTQKKDLNLKFVPFDSATGKLLKVRTFDAKLNSRTNEGPSCFSKDGQTMYLTRNTSKHGKEIANANGEFTVKIYVKQKQGDDWMGETLLPFEDDEYTFCHPTLSADGQRLYFTSNMPGGFGGMDLYVSRRLPNGDWSAPSNLGAKVNTAKNELFPFMSQEGTLFFASDGREGGQKLDLFRIDLENKTANAISLGAPFNTEADDFGFMLLPNGKKGYFSSNRKGGFGGDDIYEFDIF
ncbi:MAG: hypothetical protein RIS64_707 [Bacteroidota bacterium]